jgi:hypothetical protein
MKSVEFFAAMFHLLFQPFKQNRRDLPNLFEKTAHQGAVRVRERSLNGSAVPFTALLRPIPFPLRRQAMALSAVSWSCRGIQPEDALLEGVGNDVGGLALGLAPAEAS